MGSVAGRVSGGGGGGGGGGGREREDCVSVCCSCSVCWDKPTFCGKGRSVFSLGADEPGGPDCLGSWPVGATSVC